jgi:hypothetical protein
MKENVGRKDQALRGVTGPILMAMGYWLFGGNKGQIFGLFALVLGALIIESAITRVCPINALVGINTKESPSMRERLMQIMQ